MIRTTKAIALIALIISVIGIMATGAIAAVSTFIPLEVGARSAAMGSTYVVLADDASATVWNPAGLAAVNIPNVFIAPAKYNDTNINRDFSAIAAPTKRGNFGISFADTDLSDFAAINYHEQTYTFAYGQSLTSKLTGGVALNRVVIDSLLGAKGLSTEIGFKYKPKKDILYALRLKDVTSRLTWDNGAVESFQTTYDVGVARIFDGGPKWGKITTAISCSDLGVAVWRDSFKFGIEGNPSERLALRTGLAYGHATAGFGFKMGDGSIDAAWAYQPVLEKEFVLSGSLAF